MWRSGVPGLIIVTRVAVLPRALIVRLLAIEIVPSFGGWPSITIGIIAALIMKVELRSGAIAAGSARDITSRPVLPCVVSHDWGRSVTLGCASRAILTVCWWAFRISCGVAWRRALDVRLDLGCQGYQVLQ